MVRGLYKTPFNGARISVEKCVAHALRALRGLVGSLASLAPRRPWDALDDPDQPAGRDGRSEYALLAVLFTYYIKHHLMVRALYKTPFNGARII